MKHGFISCAAATHHTSVAHPAANAKALIGAIEEAAGRGARVIVTPELGISGCTCADLFAQRTLINACGEALMEVVEGTRGTDALCAVGIPLLRGGRLYDCAAVMCAGRLLGVAPKTNLVPWGELGQTRCFAPASGENGAISIAGAEYPFGTKLIFECEDMDGLKVAVEIGEDGWAAHPPSMDHCAAGATVILNLSAVSETAGRAQSRRELVRGLSSRLVCGYLYADAGPGESTTDMVFSAHGLIGENGTVLAETPPFGEGLTVSEIDVQRLAHERMLRGMGGGCASGYIRIPFNLKVGETRLTRRIDPMPFVPSDDDGLAVRCEEILAIQTEGLKRRLVHAKAKSAVVGLSGGLDSTLALLVAERAVRAAGMEPKSVTAVTMPCFGTSARTRSNAEILAKELGVTFKCVDITKSVKSHFDDIGHPLNDLSVTFENGQARERTQVLMDMANRMEGLVVGTGDLSELALGWATYNGDHMSMYAVNASVPKTLMRHMVRHAAATASSPALREALLDIVDTPVSPELLPPRGEEIAQKTEEIVGSYALHDFFLYHVLRWGESPAKVYRLAKRAFGGEHGEDVILSTLRLFYRRFFTQQFKRSCMPDGPKVGSVSLSPRGSWRMPSDALPEAWLKELERI